MEKEAETALITEPDHLKSDLVKVAHHGSRTSSTQGFINSAHPNLAIISVGLTSPFGHPHPEIVRRWRDSGALVLTTGHSGTITVTTDGHDLRVETYVKSGDR